MNKRLISRCYGIARGTLQTWERENKHYDELAKRHIAISSVDGMPYCGSLDELFIELKGNLPVMRELWPNKFYVLFPLPVIYNNIKYPKGVYYDGKSWKAIPYLILPNCS